MILIIDMNGRKNPFGTGEFVLPIRSIAERMEPCTVVHFSGVTARKLSSCSRVILSGTALKDYESLRRGTFPWLDGIRKPVLGICAGMQVIAKHFGSAMTDCQEIGMQKIRALRGNALFHSDFSAYALHSVGVRPSSVFEVLAASGRCVHAIKHAEKEIYWVMFHPEVRNPEIIERFVSL
jgi:GMP synthase-like glutamine amidotransferase